MDLRVEEPEITVEFYAVPRLRAGRDTLKVRARELAHLLGAVDGICPALHALANGGRRLNPHYLVSLNGQRFVSDLGQPLQAGDRVLLLSADVGG
jgi:molybdopterin converting factor small subunit